MQTALPVYERGEGTPVVFVHAFPMSAAMWEPQLRGLSGAAHVIAYDQPGFGHADPIAGAASMDRSADELDALLAALGISRCVLAGCSMGGYIAMAALRRHPARFAGIVLANTRAGADNDETRANRLRQAAETRALGSAGVIDALLPRLLSPATRAQQPGLESQVRGIMESASPEGVAQMLEAMAARPDSSRTLEGLSIPACVIVGEHDSLTPPAEAGYMADIIPNAMLHVIPGAGHLSNLEEPETFNAIMEAFLREVAA